MNMVFDKKMKESLYFEAKKAPNGVPDDFWESYSSFANTFGGTIVLGVSENENGELVVTGVTNPDKTVKILWNNLNNPRFVNRNILKNSDITIETMDDKDIIVVRIPPADRRSRPIYIKNNINSGTFKRNHEGDYHCRMDEIKEMIRESEDISDDSRVSPELGMECFDLGTISRYRNRLASRKSDHPWTIATLEEFLQLSGAAKIVDGSLHPTLAGLLMFGKELYIHDQLPNYFLDYRETEGDDRYLYRIQSATGEWSGNLFDFINEVLNRINFRLGASFRLEGYSNIGESDTFKAIREAVVNAVIHADYHLPRGVVIELRNDKILICNPGRMRVRIEDALKGGQSDPRNGNLMRLAMAIGLVERLGSGLYSIESSFNRNELSSFTIKEQTDPSRVIVSIGTEKPVVTRPSEKRNKVRKERILELIESDPQISRETIAETLGLSVKTVGTLLSEMKAEGSIEREGKTRGGRWVILAGDDSRTVQ